MVMNINAGALGANHWRHDPRIGGGRIVGEAAHFIDYLRYLAGHEIVELNAMGLGIGTGATASSATNLFDSAAIQLQFADESVGVVQFLSTGHYSFPQERLEIFYAGRTIQLRNFRRLKLFGMNSPKQGRLWRADKGHDRAVFEFIEAVKGRRGCPTPFHEIEEVAHASFMVDQIIRRRPTHNLDEPLVTDDISYRAAG